MEYFNSIENEKLLYCILENIERYLKYFDEICNINRI